MRTPPIFQITVRYLLQERDTRVRALYRHYVA